MKQRIHPKLATTSIQLKNGSFYEKRWLFFRPSLRLETDMTSHKTWSVKNVQAEKTVLLADRIFNFKKISSN